MADAAADVVVIGGGVIGCALAGELARRGVRVTVVERERPGAGASSVAAGMLAPLPESSGLGSFYSLAWASLELYPAFVARLLEATGIDVGYRRDGKLEVALDEAREAALRAAYSRYREGGHEVEWLDGAELRRLEPALAPEVRAGLFISAEHQVDTRYLTRAAWTAAARDGVRFRLGTPAAGIAASRGRVQGVSLATGEELAADRVVVAAGPWSAHLSGLPRPLPVTPVRGQIVVLESSPPLLQRTVGTGGCYLVPRRDGRLVIGSTMENVGFDDRVTGAGVQRLLGAALAGVPSAAGAEVIELRAGLRPGTRDELPILGPDPELAGLFYATGHFRNGILLAPVTAQLLADLLTDAEPGLPLTPFLPDRFAAAPAL